MAQKNIDFGSFPEDPDADAIRTAFQKTQENFTELYQFVTGSDGSSVGVSSINKTKQPGITVSAPTGNILLQADFYRLNATSSSLQLGLTANSNNYTAIVSSGAQTLFIDLRDDTIINKSLKVGSITPGSPNVLISNGNIVASNTLTIVGNANVGNLGTGGLIIATGNITGGNLNTGGILSATGNVTGGNLNTTGVVSATGNVSGGNLTTAGVVSATGNVSGGNLTTAGAVVATGNVSGGNLTTAGELSVTGNANVGNLGATNGVFTGNVNVGNLLGSVANGNSSVTIPIANGNVNITAVGNANVLVITGTGANVAGTLNATGNANVGNLGTGGLIIATGNITGGNLTTAGALSVTGNANVGNLGTAGLITATGNITGGNLTTGGALSVTGNANVGNLGTGGLITATGNITGGNLTTAGALSVTGNANVGNLNTAMVKASANVTAPQIISNIATGTSPLLVSSTTKVANLNAELLDGYDSSILAVANTVVVRDSDGSINANVLNVNIVTTTNVLNGNSNISIPSPNGNVTISSAGNANILIVTGTGVNIAGTLNVSSNLTSLNANLGNLITANFANVESNIITSNLTVNTTLTGNVANFSGNLTSLNANLGNLVTANFVNVSSNINVTGTMQAGNVRTDNLLYANGNPWDLQEAAGSNTQIQYNKNNDFGASANFVFDESTNNLTVTGNATITGTLNAGSIKSSGIANGNSSLTIPAANGNVNISAFGNANILVVTGTGVNVAGTLNATGNITGGNLTTAGLLNVTGNANVGNLGTDTAIITTGNITTINSGLIKNGTSNITIASGGNVSTFIGGNATAQLVVTATGANIAGTANVVGNANVGNLGTPGIVTALGNITGGNFITTGFANVGELNVSGNAVITGNLTVNGNTIYVNVDSFNVEDPIISLGGGPNGDPLTINDGKDRGTALEYYSGSAKTAFMGWDNSNAEFGVGSVVSITNEVVTWTTYGNLRVGNIIGNGQSLTGLSGINVTGVVANANYAAYAGNVTVASQPNITSVGTLTSLSVTGNTISGNFIGVFANGNSNVNIPAANGNVNISAVGNANVLVVTGTGANITGTANVSGNANVGNIGTTGLVITGNVTGNLVPSANTTYDLGSDTQRWRDLYLSGTTLKIGSQNISSNTTSIIFTGVMSGNGAGITSLNASNITTGTLDQARLANSSLTVNGVSISLGGSGTISANAAQAVTFNNSGSGDVSGTTFNGGTARTVSYNTVGAPSTSGTNATGNWNISISGSAGSATTAGTVTTAAQPNITSVGTLTSLSVSGNTTTGGVKTDNYYYANGAPVSFAGTYSNSNVASYLPTYVGNVGLAGGATVFNGTTLTTGSSSTAGTITGNWTLSSGSRMQATYADLAEKYTADNSYEPGTVLMFGGENEVTLSDEINTHKVAGVVSTNPAYVMNSGCIGQHVVDLALQGRVPVKVFGPVSKGDLMVSGPNGHAIANNMARAGTIIGKALENFLGDQGMIEIVVGRV